MGKKVKVTIKKKIIGLNVIIVLLVSTAIFGATYFEVSKSISKVMDEQLDSNAKLGYRMLERSFPGEWKVEGSRLYKGEKCFNGDTIFVDEYKKITGSPATIFLGDERISTNILKDGKRATGTKVSAEVANVVLKEGREFTGEANILNEKYIAIYIPIKDESGNVIGIWFTGVQKSHLEDTILRLMLFILSITAFFTILAIIISIMFANSINRGIKSILKSFNTISSGDLTEICEVKTNDEIGDIARDLNATTKSLRELINSIKNQSEESHHSSESLTDISHEMATSAENVSEAMQDVTKGVSSQAEDLAYITDILNEFSNELDFIVQNIQDINTNSSNIKTMANSSSKNMEQLVESVSSMKKSFEIFNGKISQLGHNINQINDITNLINSVADQTNLLALNAAIEAARAGESGRGFAVVADEIRKLAEQSKKSSEDINKLINGISGETNEMVKNSEGMGEELNTQMDSIDASIVSFRNIFEAIEKIIPQIQEVNSLTGSIKDKKDAIMEKVESTSAVAEEVAASSEQIAASSEEMNASSQEVAATAHQLSSMTDKMMNDIRKFKL